MKFRSEKHGNSCSCYRETVKPQQDLTLTCPICVLSWAIFIFSTFSVKDTCSEWKFLPWLSPSSHPERKGPVRDQGCCENTCPGGRARERWLSPALRPSVGPCCQLSSFRHWKERNIQPLMLAWKKHDEVFSGLIFHYINRSTDTRLRGRSA